MEDNQMKIKWSEKAIDTFGRFYAGQILMGGLHLMKSLRNLKNVRNITLI